MKISNKFELKQRDDILNDLKILKIDNTRKTNNKSMSIVTIDEFIRNDNNKFCITPNVISYMKENCMDFINFEVPTYGFLNLYLHNKIFCLTGFSIPNKTILENKISRMGGRVTGFLSESVDYVVASSIMSKRYQAAKQQNTKIVSRTWIDKLYESDYYFGHENYEVMAFSGLKFSVIGYFEGRDELIRLIEENGGTCLDTLRSRSNYLVYTESLSPKYVNIALSHKIIITTPDLVRKAIFSGSHPKEYTKRMPRMKLFDNMSFFISDEFLDKSDIISKILNCSGKTVPKTESYDFMITNKKKSPKSRSTLWLNRCIESNEILDNTKIYFSPICEVLHSHEGLSCHVTNFTDAEDYLNIRALIGWLKIEYCFDFSKNCNFLIAKTFGGQKCDLAMKYNIPIYSEDVLIDLARGIDLNSSEHFITQNTALKNQCVTMKREPKYLIMSSSDDDFLDDNDLTLYVTCPDLKSELYTKASETNNEVSMKKSEDSNLMGRSSNFREDTSSNIDSTYNGNRVSLNVPSTTVCEHIKQNNTNFNNYEYDNEKNDRVTPLNPSNTDHKIAHDSVQKHDDNASTSEDIRESIRTGKRKFLDSSYSNTDDESVNDFLAKNIKEDIAKNLLRESVCDDKPGTSNTYLCEDSDEVKEVCEIECVQSEKNDHEKITSQKIDAENNVKKEYPDIVSSTVTIVNTSMSQQSDNSNGKKHESLVPSYLSYISGEDVCDSIERSGECVAATEQIKEPASDKKLDYLRLDSSNVNKEDLCNSIEIGKSDITTKGKVEEDVLNKQSNYLHTISADLVRKNTYYSTEVDEVSIDIVKQANRDTTANHRKFLNSTSSDIDEETLHNPVVEAEESTAAKKMTNMTTSTKKSGFLDSSYSDFGEEEIQSYTRTNNETPVRKEDTTKNISVRQSKFLDSSSSDGDVV